ncbi:hypothetical protein ACH5RR_015127 [Cinchona calisaya]|uniref:Transcriptional corepressor LEUNIG n=1 Tax=Cinchona calisaya TaxID=153742 RepID=A0ABD2ZTG3_9GENT
MKDGILCFAVQVKVFTCMIMGDWDAQKILDKYIHDYMKRKNMHETAEIFAQEANVDDKAAVAIDAPEGFLKEWWSLFWDVFSSRLESSSQAAAATGNVPQNFPPVMPRPPMSQQTIANMQLNPFASSPRPELNQQAMSAVQTLCPMLPMPEMNQQVMSAMPNLQLEAFANFPANPGFEMYEQEYLKRSARELAANLQLLDVDKMTPMLPSSSKSSCQPQTILQNTQQQQIAEENQNQKTSEKFHLQLARDGRHGINIEASKAAGPITGGAPRASDRKKRVSDAGKGKSIQQIPVLGHLLTSAVLSFPATRHQVSNSSASVPEQQQQISAFAGHYQQYHLVPEAQKVGKPTLSASGSLCNLASSMLIDGDSSGKVLQLPGDTQIIGLGKVAQQHALGAQSGRKRKTASNLVPVGSAMDGKDTEVEKPMDEDIQQQFSHDNDNPIDMSFSFKEVGRLHSSNNKLLCCHFTSTGRLLAGAGFEKKILIWDMESSSVDVIEGHSNIITDVRFRPNSTVFATSSFDKTVQIWDASEPKKHPFKLGGHSEHVMSLDFHPRQGNLLCSCDSGKEMRIWNVNKQICTQVSQGVSKQVRFQPRHGDFLASIAGNVVNLIDIETNAITCQLKGHAKDIRSFCWDTSGKYIAAVSEDSARMWTINSSGRCIYELHHSGDQFESCTFHPGYSQLMVIGTYQTLELWNPTDSNRTQSYHAHDGIIAALTDSPHTETIASASHDMWLKLWK